MTLRLVKLGPVVSLVALLVVMSIASPYFLTETNLQNVAGNTSVVAALGVGELIVILTRGIDLSVGSIVALSGVLGGLAAGSSQWSNNSFVFIAVALGCGLAVGLVNGTAYVYGRVPHPFIVTLATLSVVQGIALLASNGTTVTTIPGFVVTLGNGTVAQIPIPLIIVLLLAVVGAFLLRTQWGRWVYAVGGNPAAATAVGIPTRGVLLLAYMFCGLSAGVAAIIATGRTASASPLTGINLELDAITAVIVGGASFFGGRGTVENVLVGAFILGVIDNGLNLLSVNPFWQYIATGVVIFLAVELDVLRGALENRIRVRQALK